jgi:hypothetical protein
MTESDWLNATAPQPMLEFLRGKVSDRKLRLFAVACCRRYWHLFTDERCRRAVEVSERYADGQADADELAAATEEARVVWDQEARVMWGDITAQGPRDAIDYRPPPAASPHDDRGSVAEQAGQAHLLRELFGPWPFRRPTLDPSVLAWNGGVVRSLAQAAYDDRQLPSGHLDPDRLLILADALEEAGCSDAELLSHLHGPGPHYRGCWALDVVLGKG